MLFNSLQFLLFFTATTCLYFALPHRYRWFLLLVASCFFYAAFIPVYLVILFLTITIDYFAGIFIDRFEGHWRKFYLILSIVTNVSILAFFKYYNFFINNLDVLLSTFHFKKQFSISEIILPIGLSFHTFQAMSYTIEVFRKNQKPERNYGIYALYVMFYPQLVAGPIERPQNMLHQFYEKHHWNAERFKSGLLRITWGLFKKAVIADRLALIVNNIFDKTENQTTHSILMATFFFSFQIYCDFSGYSDIALGTAEILGFKLMENFKTPYFSSSFSEFWQRWHISLSTWFRDYLYIPLGGNKVSLNKIYRNILIVFILSGLWHGANWGFIIWGCLHGIYLITERTFKKWNWSIIQGTAFKVLITFILCHLCMDIF